MKHSPNKDLIIEFFIDNKEEILLQIQPYKLRLLHLTDQKNILQENLECFKMDIFDQYEAKIKQQIAFLIAERLSIPIEEIIIILETMDLDEYLKA